MSNLAKVVAQLRQQRDEAQRQAEQLDEALAAPQPEWIGCTGQSLSALRNKTQKIVSTSPEENRCGTARALGKMESCSEEEIDCRLTHKPYQ
jgi:hypothetical protein